MIERRKVTAEEVRRMPVGTKVRIHGRDRRGYATTLDCTIVQYGKSKALSYLPCGYGGLKKIAKLDGEVHYYSVESGE